METLTALAISLCSQWSIAACTEWTLGNRWLKMGGFCGGVSCNWLQSCPNTVKDCPSPDVECQFIATYPTIGNLRVYRKYGTMDGEGGKAYLCRRRDVPVS